MSRKMNFHDIDTQRVSRRIVSIGWKWDRHDCVVVSNVKRNWGSRYRVCLQGISMFRGRSIDTDVLTKYGFPAFVALKVAACGSMPRPCNAMHLSSRPIRQPSFDWIATKRDDLKNARHASSLLWNLVILDMLSWSSARRARWYNCQIRGGVYFGQDDIRTSSEKVSEL